MTGLRVLVVGASIAGPSTAYWMARAGAKVTLIERFPDLRPGGQAVDIRTCGVSVMRKMPGMERKIRDKSAKEDGICFVRENGKPYGIIKATGDPNQQSLISEYEILRGDLVRILYDMTAKHKNIRYIFGEQIASMQQSDDGDGPVRVNFANKLASEDFDLVVACDGATSRTRAIGLECDSRDHIVPTNWWTAYFSTTKNLLETSRLGQAFNAVGGRSIAISASPDGTNRVMLTRIRPRYETGAMIRFREALSRGEGALKSYITEQYRDVEWKTQLAMQEIWKTDDFYASEIIQVKLQTLHKGRFVLVGDSGYATGPTGGGTSLALTGGYILAGEIARCNGDIATGLRRYEEQIRPLITEMQKIPPLISTIFAPQTVWGIWIRNCLFAFVAWTRLIEIIPRYLGSAFRNAREYPVPEYKWPIEDAL